MDKDIQEQLDPGPEISFDEFPPTSYPDWRKEAETTLKGAPFEKRLLTKTYEGITIEPIYFEESARGCCQAVSFPGLPDYLRGTKSLGYIGKPWSIAQACEEELPEKANIVIQEELKSGSNTIHLILDDFSLRCLDPAEPDVSGENKGLSLSNLQDMDATLRSLDLSSSGIHVFAGASAAPMLALFAARMRAQGESEKIHEVCGCIGADPLGMLALDGNLPCGLDELYDEMALSIQWANEYMPSVRTILIRGDVYHEGGAGAIQELACAMSSAIAYVRALKLRGLDIESISKQVRFSFSLGANFFMEIAKLRAARIVWSQVVKAFGGDGSAGKIDLFASTSRFMETRYDPYVNVLRTTSQAFSGVLGGVDGLFVRRFDEASRLPAVSSRRIARNIQILLSEEFNLIQPVDPSGGSWYVETLTRQVAEESWNLLQQIEACGGMAEALRSGFIQEEVSSVLASRFEHLDNRSDRAVGTNMYPNLSESPLADPDGQKEEKKESRRNAIAAYREVIDEIHCRECLGRILDQVSGIPTCFIKVMIESFMAGATLHEVRRTLNDGFAGDVKVVPIRPHRWTEQYEVLRKRTEDFIARTGDQVRVFLANMGPVSQHKARADFSTAFMEVAHFEVLKNDGFATVAEALKATEESGADICVICSTDDTYPELVPPLTAGLKASCPGIKVLLAGAPAPEHKEAFIKAGVDEFIHVRANCRRILETLQKAKGIY